MRMIINRINVALYGNNYCKMNIRRLLVKDINTKNPIKKLQYIIEIVRFLILLFLTKGLSSRSEISLSPTTL
jgi:hypothetical protein